MTAWISVEDRLPEDGSMVLTYGWWEYPDSMRYVGETETWYDQEGNWPDGSSPVTHWQPLPPPPPT